MSLHVTHRSGALVVVALAAARDNCLDQLTTVLADLVSCADRVVLDVSQVTFAPSSRVSAFMEHLARVATASSCEVIVVAERLSARRILRAAAPGDAVAVVSSLEAAIGETGADAPRVPAPRQRSGVPADLARPRRAVF